MDDNLALDGNIHSGFDERQVNNLQLVSVHLPVRIRGDIQSPLEKNYNLLLKTVFDISLAFVLTVSVLSWLIPLAGILIKLDSKGPVFFLQKRNKKNGKVFTCIKFRTMLTHTHGYRFSGCDEKRITRVGRFLRYHHIDELPQLLNVLVGDMSVIGPRPHMISENQRYNSLIEQYNNRHKVKPGITGLAQSLGNFGSINDMRKAEQRTSLDIEYVTNWSLGMDVKILYRTFRLILKHPVAEKTS